MLDYPDRCVVTRDGNETDRFERRVKSEVYNGPCDFQPGGQTSLSVVTSNDVVYLPGYIPVAINDEVEVTTELGETRRSVVCVANKLKLSINASIVTELELKQSRIITQ